MCRWLAYSGGAVPLEELIINPEHSLIDQSLSAHMAPQPTNGDGFGLGWYGRLNRPATYHSVQPAWNDGNLRDLAFQIESPLFLAHVRRSTGTPVQTSNCHPFRYENWLFVHNGLLREFQKYRRQLMLEIAPEYFRELRGSTDSEIMFYLALTYGLEDDPIGAVEKMTGLVDVLAAESKVEKAIQMTLGIADGERLYAVRYSTEGDSRTLYHSENAGTLRALFPDHPRAQIFPDDARAVVSEPLSDVSAAWIPVPESTAIVVQGGKVESMPFSPHRA